MTTSDLYGLSGQVLDGQFRIDRVVGEGGFSVVYRGQHLGLDEPVAIKCLKLQAQLGSAVVESFIRRFRDESKLHYRLSRGSLHIVRTIAAGTTMAPATGALVPYMVLEWLEGFTLGEQLRARRLRGERGRDIHEILRLFEPVAEAMAYAHAQGVVHRDLTPSNIFFAHAHDDSSQLKVLDFGVAKVISDHALALGPRAATLGHVRLFTPAYAAPEQFDESVGAITARTDVYSFAMLLIEVLGDRAPIDGEHFGDFADRALDRALRPTPRVLGLDVSDAVNAVLSRGIAVDPAERPSDIGELWTMLKQAATRDARAPRWASGPGFPLSPDDIAPSARAGYVTRATLGSLPSAPRNDLDDGLERILGFDVSSPAAGDAGSFQPPATRRGGASGLGPSALTGGDAALRAAMGPRRSTLLQGTIDAQTGVAAQQAPAEHAPVARVDHPEARASAPPEHAQERASAPPAHAQERASAPQVTLGAQTFASMHQGPAAGAPRAVQSGVAGAIFSGPSIRLPEATAAAGSTGDGAPGDGAPGDALPRTDTAHTARTQTSPPAAERRSAPSISARPNASPVRTGGQPAAKPNDLDFWIGAALALTVALVLVALIASQLAR